VSASSASRCDKETDLELTRTTINLERVGIVGPDGQPTAEARYDWELPVETLCRLYELMVVTRDLDGEFVNLQRQGELALFPSGRGQEAARIGATACLHKTDWLFPQYRRYPEAAILGMGSPKTRAVVVDDAPNSPIPLRDRSIPRIA
jgi:pyruvate dehydrogenase E1 component alpha subunit